MKKIMLSLPLILAASVSEASVIGVNYTGLGKEVNLSGLSGSN